MSQTTKNDGTQTGSGTPATDAEMKVALAESLSEGDLQDLCDATVDAINAGGGFGWVSPPPRDTLERYWQQVFILVAQVLGTFAALAIGFLIIVQFVVPLLPG